MSDDQNLTQKHRITKILLTGDSMGGNNGSRFSTYDRDQDLWHNTHCAKDYLQGAWWFRDCAYSNLNAHTYSHIKPQMMWYHFTTDVFEPIKTTTMKMKPT